MIQRYIDEANFEDTGFSYTLSLISGKHKMVILCRLTEFRGPRRVLAPSAEITTQLPAL